MSPPFVFSNFFSLSSSSSVYFLFFSPHFLLFSSSFSVSFPFFPLFLLLLSSSSSVALSSLQWRRLHIIFFTEQADGGGLAAVVSRSTVNALVMASSNDWQVDLVVLDQVIWSSSWRIGVKMLKKFLNFFLCNAMRYKPVTPSGLIYPDLTALTL